jgi:hypothetical protein
MKQRVGILSGLVLSMLSALGQVAVVHVEDGQWMDVKQIKSFADNIDASTAATKANTDVMRAVMAERQKAVLALNQIALLHDTGLVLLTVGPTDQIAAELSEMVGDPNSNPKSISLRAMPALSSPSSAIAPFKSLRNSITGVTGQIQSLWGQVSSLPSDMLGAAGSGPFGLLDAADMGFQVFDSAGNLITQISGIVSRFDALVYTGKKFIGTDWTDIDGVMGMLGAVISLDREVPVLTLACGGQLLSAVEDARSGWYRARHLYYQGRGLLNDGGNLIDNAGSLFQANSDAARREQLYQFGDGLYVRPQSDIDGAYAALVQRGSGAQQMAFYSSVTRNQGVTYDPIVGNFTDGDRANTYNLNNSLSGGAYFAVEAFNQRKGGGANPYAEMAAVLAPALPVVGPRVAAGEKLVATTEDIALAQTLPPIDLRGYPRLTFSPEEEDKLIQGICDAGYGLRLLRRVSSQASATSTSVLAVTLTEKEKAEYLARMDASDVRMKQNSRMLNIATQCINYTQRALEAVSRLRSALTGIAGEATQLNALETVPVMIQNCDQMVLFLQRQATDYSMEVERLLKERNAELSTRAAFRRNALNTLRETCSARVGAALLSKDASDARNMMGL